MKIIETNPRERGLIGKWRFEEEVGVGQMGPRRIGTAYIGGKRSASNGEETERNKGAEMERGLRGIQKMNIYVYLISAPLYIEGPRVQ